MKTWYDRRARDILFEPGQKVWFYNPRRIKGRAPKLQSSWEGPYEVTKRISEVVYEIRKSARHRRKIIHANRVDIENKKMMVWFAAEWFALICFRLSERCAEKVARRERSLLKIATTASLAVFLTGVFPRGSGQMPRQRLGVHKADVRVPGTLELSPLV
ncbi:hypothetical protein DMN91_003328 [Ooceraea biroi]|uniref:Integrase p58-like C-terminal domain-containing protein n=1 Tax=Ooceraea biroi TaxID=2015173 RepID=A0A3L8DYN9_OOCBI|nr:hypothetical protein DMN91_003328 [Ooceraea biroi]